MSSLHTVRLILWHLIFNAHALSLAKGFFSYTPLPLHSHTHATPSSNLLSQFFFLSRLTNTQRNHWTKRVVNTWLITLRPGNRPGTRTVADRARGKRRGFSPAAAVRHSPPSRAHTDVVQKNIFPRFFRMKPALLWLNQIWAQLQRCGVLGGWQKWSIRGLATSWRVLKLCNFTVVVHFICHCLTWILSTVTRIEVRGGSGGCLSQLVVSDQSWGASHGAYLVGS